MVIGMLGKWIRKLLTRKVVKLKGKRRTLRVEDEEPEEKLVILTEFFIITIIALSAIEIVHMIVLKQWNENVFYAVTGLTGTVTGIIIGRKT